MDEPLNIGLSIHTNLDDSCVEHSQTVPMSPTALLESLQEDWSPAEQYLEGDATLGWHSEPNILPLKIIWMEEEQVWHFIVRDALITSPHWAIKALFFNELSSLHPLSTPDLFSRENYLTSVADIYTHIENELEKKCQDYRAEKFCEALTLLRREAAHQRDRFALIRPGVNLSVGSARDAIVTATMQTTGLDMGFRERLLVGHLLTSCGLGRDLIRTWHARAAMKGLIDILNDRKLSVPVLDGAFDAAYMTAVGLTYSDHGNCGKSGNDFILLGQGDAQACKDEQSQSSAKSSNKGTSRSLTESVGSLGSTHTSIDEGECATRHVDKSDDSRCPLWRELTEISRDFAS